MSQERISAIAAIGSRTRALGRDGKLLWKLPEDMKKFKETTLGNTVIMGRKTFESIGKALPDRTNIVVTRDKVWRAPNIVTAPSVECAIAIAQRSSPKEVFIIGGGEVYDAALPYTNRLYLTLVNDDADGDAFFPPYEKKFTKVVTSTSGTGAPQHEFVVLEKP